MLGDVVTAARWMWIALAVGAFISGVGAGFRYGYRLGYADGGAIVADALIPPAPDANPRSSNS